MNDATPPALPLSERRDRIVDALCRHYANDHLTLEEFERRLDLAHQARSAGELDALLDGLPATGTPAPTPAASWPDAATRLDRGNAIAILGGCIRKGRWTPPAHTFAFAAWGGVELDFREARLPPGITEVSAFTIMGGIEIVVPPGVVVESDGVAILGGFDQRHSAPETPSPDAPILRIRGLSFLGGVEIRVREPGTGARGDRKGRRSA